MVLAVSSSDLGSLPDVRAVEEVQRKHDHHLNLPGFRV
jgi:hypothetical protein